MRDNEFLRTRSPRIGERATRLVPLTRRYLGIAGIGVGVWAAMYVIGARSGQTWLVATAIVLAAVDLVVVVTGIVYYRRLNRAMSEFLDLPQLAQLP